MSEKPKKTKKISTKNKNLLEVLREQFPLNAKHWSRKIELTLGECILIFYDIEPIPPLSNNIQTHIFSAIFNDNLIVAKKLKKKKLIEQTFSSANEITKENLRTYLEEELTVEDLIQEIDKAEICDKLIQRWCPSSPRNKEVLRLLTRKEFFHTRLCDVKIYKFSGTAFSRVMGNKGELFFPCLLRPLFGELLKQSEIKVPSFFEASEESANAIPDRYKNSGDFWTEYRRIEENYKSNETNGFYEEVNEDPFEKDAKKAPKNIIKYSGFLVYRKLKKGPKKNDIQLQDILDHQLIKDIRQALEKHSNSLDFRMAGNKANTVDKKEGSIEAIKRWLEEMLDQTNRKNSN